MSVDSSIGPARRRTFTPYVMLYLLAATMAGAYLVFLGVRPDIVAMWRAKPNETQTALIETQRKVEMAVADLNPIKEGVGEVKAEVASVRAGLAEAAERDRILFEKVETLERTAATLNDKVATSPAGKKQAVAKAAAPAAEAAAAAGFKTSTSPAKPAGGIETGSIEQKAAPAKPAQVGVLLATGPSLDSLRLSWTILNDRHADAVRTLNPRYVVSGKDNERTFGLVAGPLGSVADAKAVCKTMTDRGMPCEISQYRGNAF